MLVNQKTLLRKETKRFEKKQKEVATKEKILKRPSFVSESEDMVQEFDEENLDFEPRAETSKAVAKAVNFNPTV